MRQWQLEKFSRYIGIVGIDSRWVVRKFRGHSFTGWVARARRKTLAWITQGKRQFVCGMGCAGAAASHRARATASLYFSGDYPARKRRGYWLLWRAGCFPASQAGSLCPQGVPWHRFPRKRHGVGHIEQLDNFDHVDVIDLIDPAAQQLVTRHSSLVTGNRGLSPIPLPDDQDRGILAGDMDPEFRLVVREE